MPRPLSLAALVAALCLGVACARTEAPERTLGTRAAMLQSARLTPVIEPSAQLRPEHHVLATLRLAATEATLLDAREVDFPLPRERAPEPEPWRVLVEDGDGRVLYLAQLKAPAPVRGELARPDGTFEETHAFVPATWTIAVRVPVLRGAATLRVFGPASSLSPEDPRARGVSPDTWLELGKVTLPRPEAR